MNFQVKILASVERLDVSGNLIDTIKKMEELIMNAAPVEWYGFVQKSKNTSEELSEINDASFENQRKF